MRPGGREGEREVEWTKGGGSPLGPATRMADRGKSVGLADEGALGTKVRVMCTCVYFGFDESTVRGCRQGSVVTGRH